MIESSDVMIDNLDLGESGVAGEVFDLQRLAYRSEAELIGFDGIPPLHESIDDLRSAALDWLGIREGDRLVAALAMVGWHACATSTGSLFTPPTTARGSVGGWCRPCCIIRR